MFYFYLVIACVTVPLAFLSHWFLSKKKLEAVARVNMVMYSLYFIAETVLAFADPNQLPVLIFNIVNVWAIWRAYKLHQDIKKEKGC